VRAGCGGGRGGPGAAVIGRLPAAYDAKEGHLADGQRALRAWLVNRLGVTKGQAGRYRALARLAVDRAVLWSALRKKAVARSVALQLALWTWHIPAEFPRQAETILVAAAQAGARLRELAAIYAEIRGRTASPGPGDGPDPRLDRSLAPETTMDGAGVLRGDLTPECAAMVAAVLDALATRQPGGDLRTRPQRYYDALEEAMRRLLASNLLPARAGQPAKALVHIGFPGLAQLEQGSVLQDTWITGYRARWAAQRAAVSVTPGDGGAWLDGDAALGHRVRRDAHPGRRRRHRPRSDRAADHLLRAIRPHPRPRPPRPRPPQRRPRQRRRTVRALAR